MIKRFIIFLSTASIAFGFFSTVATYHYFSNYLDSKEKIVNHSKLGVLITDRNGEPFFSFYGGGEDQFVPLDNIPQQVQQAVIAAEDSEFYYHPGFSVRGIVRSAIKNIQLGTIAYGGSTITQQLAKHTFLSPEKSFLRKYKEVIIAYSLEEKYSKNDILEMYLNTVYFGRGAYGIGDASLAYFNKEPEQLNLSEASYLAGLLASPSYLASDLDGGQDNAAYLRQSYVLNNMIELKYITEDQKENALKTQLAFESAPSDLNEIAPHVALMVIDQLKEKYDEEELKTSGLTVKTTIDLEEQKYAEELLKNHVNRLAGQGVSNGALVVMDSKTSEVRALVGSSDWYDDEDGRVNMAITPRQPGSSFKPLVYAAAFENRIITPATVLEDKPTTFGVNYRPQNYDRRFRGKVVVRRALANSLNVPSVEVMELVGVPQVLSFSKKLGISSLGELVDYGPSLVLGTGAVSLFEMTNAYATFANEGKYNEATVISTITDKYGEVAYQYEPQNQQAIETEVVYQITSILSDKNVRREVFGSALDVSRPAAVKTGTTENYRDSWTLGYTPQMTIGVWIGNNDNSPMGSVPGSLGAAPAWRNLIEEFHRGIEVAQFQEPDSIVAVKVCNFNGLPVRGNIGTASAVRTEYFIEGTVPARTCVPTRAPEKKEENKDKKPEEQNQPTPSPELQLPPGIPEIGGVLPVEEATAEGHEIKAHNSDNRNKEQSEGESQNQKDD